MGGLCKPSTTTGTSSTDVVSGTTIPEWVSTAGQNIFENAANIASTPYQPYTGPRIAPFSASENAAFGLADENIGSYQPGLNAAGSMYDAAGATAGGALTGADARINPAYGALANIPGAAAGAVGPGVNYAMDLAGGAAAPWDKAAMQQYMNPFVGGVLDVAAGDLNRQFDIQRRNEDAAAGAAAAYGDARHGIINSEGTRNRNRALSDLYTTGYGNAYRGALGAFGADQNRKLGAGNLALGAAGTGLAGVNAGAGAAQAMGNLGLQQGQLGLQGAGALSSLGNQYAQLGTTAHNLGLRDVDALMSLGGVQRDLSQASLDTAYSDFQNQMDYPYRQTNFAIGALKGVPYDVQQFQKGTGTVPIAGTSALGQGAGALGALYTGYKLFG